MITTKRNRNNEMTVYISKKHHSLLKDIASAEGRSMRVVLQRWIESNKLST